MTKKFYGLDFKVYTDTKIEGDFIKPYERVYFENDIEITGHLKVKCLKTAGSIDVHKSYEVSEWEEIGGYQKIGEYQEIGWSQEIGKSQKIGGYQKIGEYQEIGWSQEIGEYQEIGGYQKIGWSQKIDLYQEIGGSQEISGHQEIGEYQKIGGHQEIGKYQEIGEYQEIGGNQEIGGDLKAGSSLVQLYSKVDGKYEVAEKVFIGVCVWRDTTEEEETLTCGKFVSGDVKYGKVKEIGLEGEPKETPKKIKIRLAEGQIVEGEIVE